VTKLINRKYYQFGEIMILTDLKTITNLKNRIPDYKQCVTQCDCCCKEFTTTYGKTIMYRDLHKNDLCRSCRVKSHWAPGGHRHAERKKLSESQKGITLEERWGFEKASSAKAKISKSLSGENHPCFGSKKWHGCNENYNAHLKNWKGKTFDEIFGKEKSKIIRDKLSAKCSGSKNPMYGKPPPQGSGNGWSGWYKETYFRSLLELSYLKYLIDNSIKFENGELKSHMIYYTINETQRTYHPDYYLIDSDELIEIKPKKLLNSSNNVIKFAKAKELFGEKFKIITEENIEKILDEDIKIMKNSGDLIFIDRYEEKYKNKYEKIH
jgi:hypothetical protein